MFDAKAADDAVWFFERFLRHLEGPLAGKPFVLDPWQVKIVRDLIGTKRDDGLRQYRTAYIEVPRKNGKSLLVAGLALFLLFVDREKGAQIYSAAADREQARIVFGFAKSMIEASPELLAKCTIYKDTISLNERRASYKVLSADAVTKHGLGASAILFDELHVQKTRDLWDTLKTSTVHREQPLTVAITTAGYDRNSICWDMHQKAAQQLAGLTNDSTFYPVIYAAGDKDDWTDPEVWKRANPGFGISVREDYLATESEDAQNNPAQENTFRRLHLNQWTEQETRWLPMEIWGRGDGDLDLVEYEGRECFAGLDLGWADDLSSLVLLFPADDGGYDLFSWFWCADTPATIRSKRDRVGYRNWIAEGFIDETDGEVTDFGVIVKAIEELSQRFVIHSLALDPRNATQTSIELDARGINVFKFGQTYANFHEPMTRMMVLLKDAKLRHGSNPVLRWMAANVVVKTYDGYIRPDKMKSGEKIDGIVALAMSLGLALTQEVNASTDLMWI